MYKIQNLVTWKTNSEFDSKNIPVVFGLFPLLTTSDRREQEALLLLCFRFYPLHPCLQTFPKKENKGCYYHRSKNEQDYWEKYM